MRKVYRFRSAGAVFFPAEQKNIRKIKKIIKKFQKPLHFLRKMTDNGLETNKYQPVQKGEHTRKDCAGFSHGGDSYGN